MKTPKIKHGLILRAFSRTREEVESKARSVAKVIEHACSISVEGRPWFDKIMVLIPTDQAYEQCDIGGTAKMIREFLPSSRLVSVEEVASGDNFCGTLNYGMKQLLAEGIDYATVLSSEAHSYLTDDIARQTCDAVQRGAKVVGVAIAELADSIREGRVANTFATWDVKALDSVGGFDTKAAQMPYGNEEQNLRAGVEEIIPLLRLTDIHKKCIAIVQPPGNASWAAPDREKDPEGHRRYTQKIAGKFERQTLRAKEINMSIATLKDALM